MGTTGSADTAQPVATPARAGRGRLTLRRSLIALVGLGWLGAMLLLQLDRGPEPLFQAAQPDGSTLKLWHVGLEPRKPFILRPALPESRILQRCIGVWRQTLKTSGTPQPGTFCVYLSRGAADGTPLHFDDIGHCVLTDESGWNHLMLGMMQEMFQGPKGNVSQSSHRGSWNLLDHGRFRGYPPAAVTPPQEHHQILLCATFPALPPQSATLQLWSRDKQLVGTLPVRIPGTPAAPQEFLECPVTLESSGLQVTLNGLSIEPFDEQLPGIRPYKVIPDLTIALPGSEAGGGKEEFRYDCRIWDAWGTKASPNYCLLSPNSPYWRIRFDRFELQPAAQLSLLPETQVWKSRPLAVPGTGEAIDLDDESEVDGVRIRFVKLVGPGHHEFTTELPDQERARHVDVQGANGRTRVQATPRDGKLEWTIDGESLTLIFLADGKAPYNLNWRASMPDFEMQFLNHARINTQELSQLQTADLRFLPATAKSVSLEFLVSRPRTIEFIIKPPKWGEDTPATPVNLPEQTSTTSQLLDANRKRQEGG